MFELVKAYEIAKGEKNKLLRSIYIKYTKYKLKKVFFNKFDVYNMDISKEMINEFIDLYKCINDEVIVNKSYPYINSVSDGTIKISYHWFKIEIKYYSTDSDTYYFTLSNKTDPQKVVYMHLSLDKINMIHFREIILMTIYNYCVSYIYGNNSNKLFLDENITAHIKYLIDLYI